MAGARTLVRPGPPDARRLSRRIPALGLALVLANAYQRARAGARRVGGFACPRVPARMALDAQTRRAAHRCGLRHPPRYRRLSTFAQRRSSGSPGREYPTMMLRILLIASVTAFAQT